MFKIEGLSVPNSVKVDEAKKKKKAEPAKLSGDDLQGMFSELNPERKAKHKRPESSAKPEPQSVNDAAKAKQQQRRSDMRETMARGQGGQNAQNEPKKRGSEETKTQPTKRAKAARSETPKPSKSEVKSARVGNQERKRAASDDQSEGNVNPASKPKPKPKLEQAQPSRGPTSTKQLTPLQLKMQQKLSGSRFRWINEQLYTTSSEHAFHIFQEQPQVFQEYHEGFRHQVESWPENPVVSLVQQFKDRLQKPLNAPGGLPADKTSGQISVADMGCGEAELALELGKFQHRKAKFNVHSFDLYAANERITAADIANVPLPDESCHVVVFCLALMGTNLVDFLTEGIRVLKPGGLIWIAEIKSRFSGYDTFIDTLKQMGLYHKTTDESNKMFVKFEFAKLPHKMAQATEVHPDLRLKPCIYKRR